MERVTTFDSWYGLLFIVDFIQPFSRVFLNQNISFLRNFGESDETDSFVGV